jgi:hypothetical protein
VLEIAQNYESYCLITKQLVELDLKIDRHLSQMVVDTVRVYRVNESVAKKVEEEKKRVELGLMEVPAQTAQPKEEQRKNATDVPKLAAPPAAPSAVDEQSKNAADVPKVAAPSAVYPTSLNLLDPFKQGTSPPPKNWVVLDFVKVHRQYHQHEIPFDIQGDAFKV